jgi:pteridine reductase
MADQQRVALVTGGAKRVGRAISMRLLAAGFDLAVTYQSSEEAARSLVEHADRVGRWCSIIKVDLTQPDGAAEQIHRHVSSAFSRLDVLVNNASVYQPARLSQTDSPLMSQLLAIHVQSPLLLCQKFEVMLRSSHGHVINMVDLLAEKPWPQYLAYCASKAALANLTLGLARELAPQVTVNGIAPGVVEWPQHFPEEEKERYLRRVPLQRAGAANDVAELVHFLCTGGNYITGQIIRLDGGRSIT